MVSVDLGVILMDMLAHRHLASRRVVAYDYDSSLASSRTLVLTLVIRLCSFEGRSRQRAGRRLEVVAFAELCTKVLIIHSSLPGVGSVCIPATV